MKSVYMIGIGGISMSAIALMLKVRGIEVCGSDIKTSALTERLKGFGIDVKEGESPEFVRKSEAVIFTGAISEDNSDISLAKTLGKPVYSRAEILGEFSKEKKTIAISGTHGKTTTTGMISSVLLSAGEEPLIHIGGNLNCINSNLYLGEGEYFVTEACEYKDSFLNLSSFISVVLNIEEDHLDYFKNYDNILRSFNKFILNTQKGGFVVYNYDLCKDKLNINIDALSFGFLEGADLQVKNIIEYKPGRFSFDSFLRGKLYGSFKLPCLGKHNIYNALATIAVCICLGIEKKNIISGIEGYQGVSRRMEIIKESPLIIHDYAHHPHEISASLKSINLVKKDKLICVFQPHTFSRTCDLYGEFLSCFDDCDEVWLLPIYPAREKPVKGISSKKISLDLKKRGKKTRYFSTFERAKLEIMQEKHKNSSFAVLGAGDIEDLANMLK